VSDHKKGVPIVLIDEKPRHLFFTAGDAKKIDKMRTEEGEEPIDQLAKVLEIGLKRDDAEITAEALLDLIDMRQLETINTRIAEAMGRKPAEVKEDVTLPLATSAPTSTDSSSGRAADTTSA
jgi:hypothetical protein